jgi:chemotaxis regulatin CheY-phosphate phosphatase CheZ
MTDQQLDDLHQQLTKKLIDTVTLVEATNIIAMFAGNEAKQNISNMSEQEKQVAYNELFKDLV